jgi:putative endonuclease
MPDGIGEVMSESCWSVYIIRCGDGSLYTGIAIDVERRFGEHVSQGPKAAKYLRGRLPLEIVYRKEIGNRSEASKEELRIKRMGVKRKVELVKAVDYGEPADPHFPDAVGDPTPHTSMRRFSVSASRLQVPQ